MRQDPTRLLVVAESDGRAATIESVLRDEAHLQVVVGRPTALARLIEEHDPTVVLLALSAARVASVLETLVGVLDAPPVVLLVENPRGAWNAAARRAGLRAGLHRDASAEQIIAAIGASSAGLFALHPDVVSPQAGQPVGGGGDEAALTGREREILEMMAEGLSNRIISRRLGISTFTVKSHVASILAKLRAGSRTEAVTLGVRSGLISL